MTIFGLSILKKSELSALNDELCFLADRIGSLACDLGNIKHDVDSLIATHGELEEEINTIKAELEPVKGFMNEHFQNILEAETEFVKQQKAMTDGINNISTFSYQTAMKKGDK